MAEQVTDPTIIYEHTCSIPGLAQWVEDPTLPWLWHKLAAVAPIQPLAWELPCIPDMALKSKKKKKEEKEGKS